MSELIATRNAYGLALAELGEANPAIVALDADVSTCTMSCHFGGKFKDRFFNVGIAEANMAGMAAGLATMGYIPLIHAFAMFATGRIFEQIRNSIAYPKLNVKIVGSHAGVSVGEDGATHQCIEDIGIMRTIPGMTIVCPADGHETGHAVKAVIEHDGPVYLRLGRLAVETVTRRDGYEFTLGRANLLKEGSDATIIATGLMVQMALRASEILAKEKIHVRVVNMHTIKPIDRDTVIKAASETGAIVTAEEHNILCGLGSAVAETVAESVPVPVMRVGVKDVFGCSGNAEAILKKYGMSIEELVDKVRQVISMKKSRMTR